MFPLAFFALQPFVFPFLGRHWLQQRKHGIELQRSGSCSRGNLAEVETAIASKKADLNAFVCVEEDDEFEECEEMDEDEDDDIDAGGGGGGGGGRASGLSLATRSRVNGVVGNFGGRERSLASATSYTSLRVFQFAYA